METKNKVCIVGHKNPDTDSICSAIAYAYLKNATEEGDFIPLRAGNINEETDFVLRYFGAEKPQLLDNIGSQVSDMDIRKTKGVSDMISLRTAYLLLKKNGIHTLPVTDQQNYLDGVITVGDIAQSCMEVDANRIVAEARTPYKNVAETLNGKIIVGDEDDLFTSGKVIIGAANSSMMEQFIDKGDMVIMGNRMEDHLLAIEKEVACLIVSLDSKVSGVIQKFAKENGTVIITTPYDTLTSAKLVNQSIPVRHLMRTKNIISFRTYELADDIKDVMGNKRYRDFPVLDEEGKYQGTISRRNLMNIKKKKIILVDHNERSQTLDNIEEAEILEIIDHHRIGSLETLQPVMFRNQPVGCTATIIFQMYQEKQVEVPKQMAGLLCSAILSDTLMFRSPTCTAADREAAESLSKIAEIQIEEYAGQMFAAGSDLEDKTPEEIFYQDFKKFASEGITFGVGQINSMAKEELETIKERLLPILETQQNHNRVGMVFFMLTNIGKERTEVLFLGKGAKQLLDVAFPEGEEREGSRILHGVVSRKKQVIPRMMEAIQEIY